MNGFTTLWRNRFSSVRGKRVIVGNFMLLALVSLLSAGMFYFFVDSIYKRNAERNLYISNMSMLVRLGGTMDIYFASLAQMMDIGMRNREFISATVMPNANHYERNKSIITYLANLTAGNKLIKDAFYFVRETGHVYTSKGQMVKLEQFTFKDAVDGYLHPGTATRKGNEISGLSVAAGDGYFFVLKDFFMVQRMGTMFFQLDTDMLSALIGGKAGPHPGGISAYDADLQPLFPGQNYPRMERAALGDALRESGNKPVKLDGVTYYHYTDLQSGWVYLLPFSSRHSFGQTLALGVIIPFLFFFLVINLAVFLYSTLSVYRPVDEIITSIRNNAEAAPPHAPSGGVRNEFDFIKNAFNHVVGANEQYGTLLRTLAPGVQERLLGMLVSGREIAPGHVRDTLAGVGSPFAGDDRFLIVAFKLDGPPERMSDLEGDVAKVGLQESLAERIPDGIHLFWFMGRNDDIVAVAGFRAESTPFQPARFLAAVDACAKEYVAKTPWNMYWGCGDIYNDILDIALSYGEAVTSLRMKQYAETDHQTLEEAAKLSLSSSAESIMEKRLENIWRQIMENDLPQAQSAALRIVDELEAQLGGEEDGNRFGVLTNVFIRRLVDMQISPEELAETERIMGDLETGEDTTEAMKKFVMHCIAMLDSYNRKRQNKYILGAIEYISEHYADSGLSLNSVSEHLGIHSNYLSHLFNESRKMPFTTVLNEHRIEMARQLLHLTTQSVADIGFKTGFNSAQNFIRVFKKHTGMTPGQFRERHA